MKNDLELMNAEKSKELEMISGTLKVTKTKKMLLCSYYRPPNKTYEDYLARVKEEFLDIKNKHKNAIYIIGGDFNLLDIDWKKSTVTNKFYQHRVRQTYLDMAQELGLVPRSWIGTSGRFPHQTRKHTGLGFH